MTAAAESPLFRALTRRPAATTVTVRELIEKVAEGAVRVPPFQRPLRWRAAQVVELLDSVWRGYPIGSLLFWKRPALPGRVQVGGALVDAPGFSDAWWIVDGQQRTTALAASLLELDHGGDARWAVSFDPERERFVAGPPEGDRQHIDVPSHVLGDLRRLGRWLRESSLTDELADRVERAQQRLLDYAIPAYVVETDDEEALRGVFARLNSTGARMRADEVFQALLGAPSSGRPRSLDLEELQQICGAENFGTPARSEMLKAVLAMSGRDPTKRFEDLGAVEQPPLVAPEDAASAIERTVSFLRQDCRIPHESLLPYPVVLVILARWFHVFPDPSRAERTLLARWLWQGAASGAHQRAEVSRMREQVRAIREGDQSGSLERLLTRAGARPSGVWELRPFQLRNARSRIEVLALLEAGPEDRLGRVNLLELVSGGRVAREIVRSAEWKGLSSEARSLARTAANRVVLGGAHTGLASQLREWTGSEHAARLRSHVLDEECVRLLAGGELEAFLRRRAEAVRLQVDRLLIDRTGGHEPDLRQREFYFEDA